ncbi:hypothetical protein SLEP1_g19716 [Rubroshorea leprosula]|uniref:Uncharacterized protein n=2 Tax=Rubroshorea leprosula TaxID=152421 RepID=A0AAV5J6A3_9ROSI|nr:hypothetical protein SLEP1_g19716 [Rubroshorea leprosula]
MMAVDLHNRELLLPSQFFTEEQEGIHSVSSKPNSQNGSLFSGSSDSGSEYLSSPVESEVGSTKSSEEEEAGGEDDYIAELTRKMAYYMFQDEDKQEKSWDLSGSPQSTLWLPLGSKGESPNGWLRETLPPVTPMIEGFEKMKINEEIPKYNPGKGLFSASIPIPLATRNPDVGFQSKKSLIDEQIRAIQFYKLKQEQAMKLMDQKRKIKQDYRSIGRVSSGFNNGQRVPSHPCAGCTLHPQQSSGLDDSNMRAVVLDTSGSKTGSGGTGVFLPRRIGTSSETRKKQRCPTVLIPAKVVHALKLHFEKMGVPSRLNTGVPLQQDAHVDGRNSISSQQKRHPWTAPAISHQDLDLGLPQEWTY